MAHRITLSRVQSSSAPLVLVSFHHAAGLGVAIAESRQVAACRSGGFAWACATGRAIGGCALGKSQRVGFEELGLD